METRQKIINEVHLWYLVLNDMRFDHIEEGKVVVFSTNPELLQSWYKDMRCETYIETGTKGYRAHNYTKAFKKGSYLEWYNPEDAFVESLSNGLFNHGVHEVWINENELDDIRMSTYFLED